jgi:transposase
MPKHVKLRELTDEETQEVRELARSRTAPARAVQRAKIIAALIDDPALKASEAALRAGYRSAQAGPNWVKRFNAEGLAGLDDRPRPGAPPTHSEEVRSKLIGLAIQKPQSLGYPFALWTLERLQRAFETREGIHLSDSTIWTWMADEGFAWKRQESWFHEAENHDPEFVEKRGALSRPTSPPSSEPA